MPDLGGCCCFGVLVSGPGDAASGNNAGWPPLSPSGRIPAASPAAIVDCPQAFGSGSTGSASRNTPARSGFCGRRGLGCDEQRASSAAFPAGQARSGGSDQPFRRTTVGRSEQFQPVADSPEPFLHQRHDRRRDGQRPARLWRLRTRQPARHPFRVARRSRL